MVLLKMFLKPKEPEEDIALALKEIVAVFFKGKYGKRKRMKAALETLRVSLMMLAGKYNSDEIVKLTEYVEEAMKELENNKLHKVMYNALTLATKLENTLWKLGADKKYIAEIRNAIEWKQPL